MGIVIAIPTNSNHTPEINPNFFFSFRLYTPIPIIVRSSVLMGTSRAHTLVLHFLAHCCFSTRLRLVCPVMNTHECVICPVEFVH